MKVILVMIDGLNFTTSEERCGLLGRFVESGQAAKYRVIGQLPAQSKPLYETLMTGLPVELHEVTTNAYFGASKSNNIFSICKTSGKSTAAAAYMWIAELYNRMPVGSIKSNRYQLNNKTGHIDNGIFYFEDHYPDSHLYADADYLLRAFSPDFLLVHPMNVDYYGHRNGSASREYQHSAELSVNTLCYYLPDWQKAGYDLVVTSDHGMDELGIHFGDSPKQREVPLYIISGQVESGDYSDLAITQLIVAPLICRLLGITPSAEMQDLYDVIRGIES